MARVLLTVVVPATLTTTDRLRPGTSARILYVDGDGRTSERTIDVICAFTGRNGVRYVRAHCHLRHESRTFRGDRVLAILESRQPDPPRAPSPPPPRRADPAADPGRSGDRPRFGFGGFVIVLVLIVIAGFSQSQRAGERGPRVARGWSSDESSTHSGAVNQTRTTTATYRGVEILVHEGLLATAYTRVSTSESYLSMHALRIDVNEEKFQAQTGLRDKRIVSLYERADRDRNGRLSWSEVQRFQDDLFRRFDYQTNNTAYSPSQFISARGGDCEDWAIVTALLFRFWGYRSYVASISSDSGEHAVTLVPQPEVGPGPGTITVSSGSYPGTYVPIDYTSLGRFSNAVGSSWRVSNVWVPERLFGRHL